MKTTIYPNKDYSNPIKVEFTKKEVGALLDLHSSDLLKRLKESVVGKVIPKPGWKEYHAAPVEISGFSLSMQISYWVWDQRRKDNKDLGTPITEEEFESNVPDAHSYVDFYASYKGKVFCDATQMSLIQIADMLVEVGVSCFKQPAKFNTTIAISIDCPSDLTGCQGVIRTMDGKEFPFTILTSDLTK